MPENTETLHDQSRWNDTKGKVGLAEATANPDEFLVSPKHFNPRVTDLLEILGDVSGKRILEYGCGRGFISVELARRGADTVGVELGPDLVELAGTVAEINGVSCEFTQGNITDIPYGDEEFDLVVGNAILHHLPEADARTAIEEAYRVLKPGGVAYFIESIENSKVFDFVQNMVPVGAPDAPDHRPSILNRKKWKHFLTIVDDRAMTDDELRQSGRQFRSVDFKYYGMLARLNRTFKSEKVHEKIASIDDVLCGPKSPIRKYSQAALVTYTK